MTDPEDHVEWDGMESRGGGGKEWVGMEWAVIGWFRLGWDGGIEMGRDGLLVFDYSLS